ncbi:MAG: saccharopine dehydrogenase C-terminal domain-containing protein, partial [Bacteroidota bacterium]
PILLNCPSLMRLNPLSYRLIRRQVGIFYADQNLALAQEKTQDNSHAEAISFDIRNEAQARREVERADLVISMLPARLHTSIAKLCLEYGRPLFTASYVSEEMEKLDSAVRQKGLLFLNEIGLDPGIDHLSAMQVLDQLRSEGANIQSVKSFAGGLVAPESDTNPWHYKFTWNPRNVVLAGQGTVRFREEGKLRFVPYHRLFAQVEPIYFPELGEYEAYPNRDSLTYESIYGLEDAQTLLRGTIRGKGFCRMWNYFVQLGIVDDTYEVVNSQDMSYRDFISAYLPPNITFQEFFGLSEDSKDLEAVRWLELLSPDRKVELKNATPAKILQRLLEEKWKLEEEDKDMIVMQHQFAYTDKKGKEFKRIDSMVVYGDDTTHTAMSKTVGLPLAISVRLFLEGKFDGLSGVLRPTVSQIYTPVLEELEKYDIRFEHEVKSV